MLGTRSWQPVLAALVCIALAAASRAAQTKPWITLTNCEYVASQSNDGDSFRVRSGTNEFRLRLYYVDAPETTLTYAERVRQQSEHYGITLDQALKTGAKARDRVRNLLRQPFIVRTRWANAGGRGREARYYGIVEVGGRSVAELLVREGLAQTKGIAPNLPSGEKAAAYMNRLENLEREARQKRLGAWAGASVEKQREAGADDSPTMLPRTPGAVTLFEWRPGQ